MVNSENGFSFQPSLRKNLAKPGPRFGGFLKYNFIGGHNDPDHIPVDGLVRAFSGALASQGRELSIYHMGFGPQGYPPLREFVARKLGRDRSILCSASEILITSGAGQGIDLVNQVLLDAGDTVIIEEFTYWEILTKLKKLNVNYVGCPMDAEGMDTHALGRILEDLKHKGVRPKYILTIPTLHNPTGTTLPMERRRHLLELARAYEVPVFEDECYADLTWEGRAERPLYSLDPRQVIHIGSFSKTLSPAVRVGYLVAAPEIFEHLLAAKQDSGTSSLSQLVVSDFFSKHFSEHVQTVRRGLKEKYEVMAAALHREFAGAVEFVVPDGGMFLWVRFPESFDVRQLIEPARRRNVAFNAGPEWSALPDRGAPYARLCFALPSKQEIEEGIRELAQAYFETRDQVETGAEA